MQLHREKDTSRDWARGLVGSEAKRIRILHSCWSYNLGQNKMEQQTPIPAKSRMKPREGQKRAIFPYLIWGGGGGLGFPFILSKIVACEQALYLGESQEVMREQHAKRVSRLASLPIHGEPANRLCWSQLVSLATVFVSSRNAPPFAVC